MLRQVEGRSVSVASNLDPAIGCLNLGIPYKLSREEISAFKLG
jgi:hypothetical protein